jgi:hypothetical protein
METMLSRLAARAGRRWGTASIQVTWDPALGKQTP